MKEFIVGISAIFSFILLITVLQNCAKALFAFLVIGLMVWAISMCAIVLGSMILEEFF